MSPDRRLTPFSGRTALTSLRGQVAADQYTDGEAARIAAPLADLLARPDGPRDRQLQRGEAVLVIERTDRHAFVRADKDGYCGWLALSALTPDHPVSHWLRAPASHLYPTPSLKRRELAQIGFGTLLQITDTDGAFARTHDGLFVPTAHLAPIGMRLEDPAAVATLFLHTPYLWGGNSRAGIDCSGLVQAALLACGIPCPGDSDQQWSMVGRVLAAEEPARRGDLLFWKGHVAMLTDPASLIHANAHHMAVTDEPVETAMARIAAATGETFLGRRRPRG